MFVPIYWWMFGWDGGGVSHVAMDPADTNIARTGVADTAPVRVGVGDTNLGRIGVADTNLSDSQA